MPVEKAARPPVRSVPVVEPRLPSEVAEAAWLREARLEAEEQWAKMFPQTAPQRDIRSLNAAEIALTQSFGQLAHEAATRRYDDQGRKFYRHDRIDEVDIDLYEKGRAAAKRLWPGI